jgi:hypothetical protein
MSEEKNKELEFYERRISNLEHTVYGNGRKGIKDELIELKTEIQTFRKMAVWQIGIAITILAALLKIVL